MQREDYLLRLIEQVGRVLARIRQLLMRSELPPETEVLDAARAAGFDLELMRALTPDTLAELLAAGGRPDALRCVLVAELMFADALIARARGDDPAAADRAEKAERMLAYVEHDPDAARRRLAQERSDALSRDLATFGQA